MGGILVITETRDSQFRKVSFEVASEAVRCGKLLNLPVSALVMGKNIEKVAPELGQYGIVQILVAEEDRLGSSYLGAFLPILEETVKKSTAEFIFFPASVFGKALAGMLAAKLSTVALNDCTGIQVEGGRLKVQRPICAGKALATIAPASPIILSLRPNVFPMVATAVETKIEKLSFSPVENQFMTKILESKSSEGKAIDLTEASVIVAGGRGMKGPEYFKLIQDLAQVLGAAMGASRAVVDAGWRPHDEQVGQTGKTVSPQLYIACGISGAIQHLAGMRTSKVIVAINKDPDAPIFQIANYGIVGDVMEVVPKMIEEAKKWMKS